MATSQGRNVFAAVLDTNVYIDVASIHDLARAQAAERKMRRQRAHDAALLAICFHAEASTTYSLRETVDVLVKKVPPESGGMEELHIKAFALFLIPEVLSRWDPVHPPDVRLSGNAADSHLTDVASERGLPLITKDGEMARRASERNVRAVTPREYWENRVDREREVRRFLSRFKARAPEFARRSAQPRAWALALSQLFDLYRGLLLDR
jgi:hypothetical protein